MNQYRIKYQGKENQPQRQFQTDREEIDYLFGKAFTLIDYLDQDCVIDQEYSKDLT